MYILWGAGVLIAVLLGLTTGSDAAMGPLSAIAVLTGLVLVSNFRGGTDALAQAMKTNHPWGVDYSRSFLATAAYGRLFGALAIVAGSAFIYAAVSSA